MRCVAGAVLAMALLASPAWAVFADPFNYPNGGLGGNDGWSGNTAGAIDVSSSQLVFTSGGAGSAVVSTINDIEDITPDANGKIRAGLKVLGGVGASNNIWSIYFNDAAGFNFARWYGRPDTARPRIGGFGQVLGQPTLSFSKWDVLEVQIDTTTHMSTFYFNGESLGSLDYALYQPSIGTTLASIQIDRMENADLGQTISMDDVWATPEPASLLLLCLGGLLLRRRSA